jgi:hypothetical protein
MLAGYTTGSTIYSSSPPAGYIWVVRNITAGLNGGTGAVIACGIQGMGYPIQLGIPQGNLTTSCVWEGRLVVMAGEALDFVCTSGSVYYSIDGYQLSAA